MPQNPDGTTTVEEVVVEGQRTTVFTIYPPSGGTPTPPLPGDTAELPDTGGGPGEPLEPTECEKEVTRDRAALEAAERINGFPDNVEHGFYLVEDGGGSVRAVGPVHGFINSEGVPQINWDLTPAELGITNWNQLVGLVHNHPRLTTQGPGIDQNRREYSQQDVDVTAAFVNAGADPNKFRQYITVGNDTYQFGADAKAGDDATPNNEVTGVNNCA